MSTAVPHRHHDRYLLTVLAVMGAVSLIDQVSWARQLTTLIGSTVTATALITAMFMVGMALGAWLIGRYADRGMNPSVALGRLALGLGLSGAAAVPLHAAVVRSYERGLFGTSSAAPLVTALGLAALMTLVPTACVGAAVPVVGRTLSFKRKSIASATGAAYAAGTTGSIAGALIGGFVLVPLLGVNATVLVGAAAALVGGAALTLGRDPSSRPATRAVPETASSIDAGAPNSILAAFTLSGAALMVYETVWTRELLLVFGASVYAVATMLAAALTGLALGQHLGGRNRQPRGMAALTIGVLQLSGAGAAMLSLLLTRVVPAAYYVARGTMPGGLAAYLVSQFVLTFAVVAVPCALLGATAPIAIRLASTRQDSLGADIAKAYALNTAGAVAGSLAGGLLILPLLSTAGSAAAAAVLNVAAALLALRAARPSAESPWSHRWLAPAIAVALLGGASLVTVSSASPLLELAARPAIGSASARDLIALARQMTVVYHKDAAQGRVTVLEAPGGTLSLRASGVNEGGIEAGGQSTETEVVTVPLAVLGEVSEVLIVGLGTGVTSATALEAPGLPRVTTVEINPAVVEASRYFQTAPLESDRSTLVADDARHYFMTADARFDLVASQPSLPLSTYAARMFTRESFSAAARLIRTDGVMVQWLPAYLMNDEDLQMMAKTFGAIFPNCHVWATRDTNNPSRPVNYLMVGVNGDRVIEPQQVAERIAASGDTTLELEHLLGPQDVAALQSDDRVPLNTDDHPRFEYRVPLQYLRGIWGQ